MKRVFIFLFFSVLIVSSVGAQEVDYVISDPSKEKKKEFRKPTISDSTMIPNPDYTAYFLSSTAYTLEKKKIRLSGTDVLFMKGSYGLTDNTMVSVNVSAFGTITASLKQQIKLNDDITLGLSGSGGMLLYFPGDSITQGGDTIITMGGGQAMVTLGDRQDNLTFGTGVYYIHDNDDFIGNGNGKKGFVLNNVYIAFQKQLGKKLYLMGEGIYFTNYQFFTGALGVKLIMGDRISLDFGLMPFGWKNPGTNRTDVFPIAIPLISFRMLLGKN